MHNNDLFAKKNWIGTFVLMFVACLLIFVVFCGLGIFIDPSLSQEVRTGIAIAWVVTAVFAISAIIETRHV